MHTESSLELLEKLTVEFGQLIRQFRDLTCAVYETVELPSETAARIRRTQESANHNAPASTTNPVTVAPEHPMESERPAPAQKSRAQGAGRRTKSLNLKLYKLHALGDYVASIRMFGTTDSYSTQLVCHV